MMLIGIRDNTIVGVLMPECTCGGHRLAAASTQDTVVGGSAHARVHMWRSRGYFRCHLL